MTDDSYKARMETGSGRRPISGWSCPSSIPAIQRQGQGTTSRAPPASAKPRARSNCHESLAIAALLLSRSAGPRQYHPSPAWRAQLQPRPSEPRQPRPMMTSMSGVCSASWVWLDSSASRRKDDTPTRFTYGQRPPRPHTGRVSHREGR